MCIGLVVTILQLTVQTKELLRLTSLMSTGICREGEIQSSTATSLCLQRNPPTLVKVTYHIQLTVPTKELIIALNWLASLPSFNQPKSFEQQATNLHSFFCTSSLAVLWRNMRYTAVYSPQLLGEQQYIKAELCWGYSYLVLCLITLPWLI